MLKTLLSGFVLLSGSTAYPFCLQPAPPSICAEYFRSALVVEGTRVAHKRVAVGRGRDALDGDLYTFEVNAAYRGYAPKSVELFDENSSGRLTFEIAKGGKYLLFLMKPSQSKSYSADGCGNSGPANERPSALAQIESLEHSTGGGLIEVKVSKGPGLQGPLADFPVTLTGTESATSQTDKDGWARFKVPLGIYSVTASHAGWTVSQFDLPYEDARNIQLKEHGQCSQVQLTAESH